MRPSVKALLLLGMGYFLFTRISGGTLFFYINARFAWLTLLAAIGFFVVASGYLYRSRLTGHEPAGDAHHEHDHHHGEDHAGHSHGLSRLGLILILLPIVLGSFVPPRPLGAAAVANREVNVGGLSSAVVPGTGNVAAVERERNLLDWLVAFEGERNPAAFSGQEAILTGFVFRDGRFEDDLFMLSRFLVSCCVADATPVGLIVRWPEASTLGADQWVEVRGHFEPGQFDGQPMPVLVADEVATIPMPNQPYLFP